MKLRTVPHLVAISLIGLTLTACRVNEIRRTSPVPCTRAVGETCSATWREIGPGYGLNFIDVADNGSLMENKQLDSAKQAVITD